MNTGEAAKKWECTVDAVRKYCSEGMISLAEKSTSFPWQWNIPDKAYKPPVTRHKAVVMMRIANAVCDGGKVNLKTLGISEENARAVFQYLQDCGFIAIREVQGEIAEAMKTIQVLPLGKKPIEADDEAARTKLKKGAKAEVGCDKNGPYATLTLGISNI